MIANVLTIAGSDSGGGAGIQADIKAMSANGVFAATVITALTAQNTVGVTAIHDVPAEFVSAQIDAVFADIEFGAVKIGMLSRVETIDAVADGLARHRARNVVIDPVMVAASGDPLIRDDAVAELVERLFPLARLVTPNLHEAAVLADMAVDAEADMIEAARRIGALGPRHVLVKGGHLKDAATDVLWDGRTLTRFPAPRVGGPATHGTGCTYSAAIAAGLARGRPLIEAITEAKRYVTAAIRGAIQAGRGAAALRHFGGAR
jgi:hydroxymethylpyrimidine/phosphomethylpyrimidine kinase